MVERVSRKAFAPAHEALVKEGGCTGAAGGTEVLYRQTRGKIE